MTQPPLLDVVSGRTFSPEAFLGEMFYLQDYGLYISFHTWSLGAEEHFTFCWPGFLVRFALKSRQRRRTLNGFPTFVSVFRHLSGSAVYHLGHGPGFTVDNYYLSEFQTLPRWILFFRGDAVSLLAHCWNESSKRRVCLVCAAWRRWSGHVASFQFTGRACNTTKCSGYSLISRFRLSVAEFMALDYIRCPCL